MEQNQSLQLCHHKKENDVQSQQFTESPWWPIHSVAVAEEKRRSEQKPEGALPGRRANPLPNTGVAAGFQDCRNEQ